MDSPPEDAKCGKCKALVTTKGLQCDYCDRWYHPECEDLTDSEYEMMRAPRFKFFCKPCNEQATGILKFLNEVKTKQDNMDKRLKSCEQQLEKCNTFQTNVEDNLHNWVRDEVYEVKERESKANNLVITNLEETQGDEEEDTAQVLSKFLDEALDIKDAEIKEARRIPNPPDKEDQPRLIVTTLANKDMKHTILKKARDLKDKDNEQLNNIYISPDLTRKQRQEGYALRQELRERRAKGETDLVIRRGKVVKATEQENINYGDRGRGRGGYRGGRQDRGNGRGSNSNRRGTGGRRGTGFQTHSMARRSEST